jgi:hypothetical protein
MFEAGLAAHGEAHFAFPIASMGNGERDGDWELRKRDNSGQSSAFSGRARFVPPS